MEMIMNTKTRTKRTNNFNNKKASYILEATIIIPLFVLGTMLLLSVVNVIRVCDSINFSVCDEIEKMQAEAIYMPLNLGKENAIASRVKEEENISNFSVEKLKYKFSNGIKDDLINVKFKAVFDSSSILDINENIIFGENILARAFTGLIQNKTPSTEEEFLNDDNYQEVFVFPNEGTKYHSETCTYVSSKPYQCILSSEISNKFSPCKICHSENLKPGSLICCYKYGKSYHSMDCDTIDKYVIKMDKSDAEKKGYTPCSKCRGGQ